MMPMIAGFSGVKSIDQGIAKINIFVNEVFTNQSWISVQCNPEDAG